MSWFALVFSRVIGIVSDLIASVINSLTFWVDSVTDVTGE